MHISPSLEAVFPVLRHETGFPERTAAIAGAPWSWRDVPLVGQVGLDDHAERSPCGTMWCSARSAPKPSLGRDTISRAANGRAPAIFELGRAFRQRAQIIIADQSEAASNEHADLRQIVPADFNR
jgi:hypothetical protein